MTRRPAQGAEPLELAMAVIAKGDTQTAAQFVSGIR